MFRPIQARAKRFSCQLHTRTLPHTHMHTHTHTRTHTSRVLKKLLHTKLIPSFPVPTSPQSGCIWELLWRSSTLAHTRSRGLGWLNLRVSNHCVDVSLDRTRRDTYHKRTKVIKHTKALPGALHAPVPLPLPHKSNKSQNFPKALAW